VVTIVPVAVDVQTVKSAAFKSLGEKSKIKGGIYKNGCNYVNFMNTQDLY